MSWIPYAEVPATEVDTIPQFTKDELGFVKDTSSLLINLQLFKAMDKMVLSNGAPIPRAKYIVPKLVAVWNMIKGGVDVYSRYLKNVKVDFSSLHPVSFIVMRLIMTMLLNCKHSLDVLKVDTPF